MALSSSTMRIRTAGSSGGIVRLLFESVPASGGAEAPALEVAEAMGAEVESVVLLVTVFMWPSLQWGLTHHAPFVKGRRKTFLVYFYVLRLFGAHWTGALESVPNVTRR